MLTVPLIANRSYLSLLVSTSLLAIAAKVQPASSREAGCLEVPAAMVQALQDGFVSAHRGKWHLEDAAAVRSNSFKRMYFISARIVGEGLSDPPPVGTWATNRLVVGKGMVFSVGPWSTKYSVYPDGSKTKADIQSIDHGYAESQRCVADR